MNECISRRNFPSIEERERESERDRRVEKSSIGKERWSMRYDERIIEQ